MATKLTKKETRRINRRVKELRGQRKYWLNGGRYINTGVPWCNGPGSPGHQELICDGCCTVDYCRDEAAAILADIDAELQKLTEPAPVLEGKVVRHQEVLW